jgi:LysR family transcriptional regulator for metE and metH
LSLASIDASNALIAYIRCMNRIDAPEQPALEVRDLRVILALARAGTTARAAEALHLTQPAVSRALLCAESKLGVRLFDRTPRGLVATATTERLLPEAARLLVELSSFEQSVRAPARPLSRLRLVAECYTAYHWLPSVLVNLRQTLPGLEVDLRIEHTVKPLDALEKGELDVALVTTSALPKKRSGPVEQRTLFKDEIVFIVSTNHPLASRSTLNKKDLESYPLITSRPSREEAAWFMRSVFGRSKPEARFERLPLTEAIIDVARAGLGIAVLSEWVAGPHLGLGGLAAKRLASGPLERPWQFAYRREVKEPALRLLDALLATAPAQRTSKRLK